MMTEWKKNWMNYPFNVFIIIIIIIYEMIF